MRLSYDRTGYPWIELDQTLAVSLLPITKYQFEIFLSEPRGLSNTWYENVLAMNPRCPCFDFTDATREKLFITGILPKEALQFAAWLGADYDLPTTDEWKSIYESVYNHEGLPPQIEAFPENGISVIAERLVTRLLKVSRIRTWHELTMMKHGIMEWVRIGDRFGCHGTPRPEFWPVTHNPLVEPPLLTFEPNRRDKQCGFRLIRRISRRFEDY